MINVKDQVYDAIKCITENVSDGYPKDWGKLPAIQYTEEDNSVVEWVDGKESKAHLLYKVDIWNNDSTSLVALEVDKAISALGLRRCDMRASLMWILRWYTTKKQGGNAIC